MEILCIADLHGDKSAIRDFRAYARSEGMENLLILGDFAGHSSIGDPEKSLSDARFALDVFSDLAVWAIPGNCDPLQITQLFEEYGVNLHENKITLFSSTLIGLGGSSPTPFNTPFEFSEAELKEKAGSLLSGEKTAPVIFAAHTPPSGTCCDLSGKAHFGSKAMQEVILEFGPEIFLCSHIHESGGCIDKLGNTIVANIGPLCEHRFGVLSLGKIPEISLGLF